MPGGNKIRVIGQRSVIFRGTVSGTPLSNFTPDLATSAGEINQKCANNSTWKLLICGTTFCFHSRDGVVLMSPPPQSYASKQNVSNRMCQTEYATVLHNYSSRLQPANVVCVLRGAIVPD